MRRIAIWAHTGFVLLAVLGSGYVLVDAVLRGPGENPPVLFEHLGVGLLCGTYSVMHLVRFRAGLLSVMSCVAFYPLFIVLSLLASAIIRGSVKAWAPDSPGEAFLNNIFGYTLLIGVGALAIWSCFPRGRRHHGA